MSPAVERAVASLVAMLRASTRAVALTGAGVSTDSGIPDFRSAQGGLWARADPMRVASIEGFCADPAGFYAFWAERFGMLADARPNATHRVLAALETRGLLHAVVTQNIDGLHQRAGSRRVLEVHGTWRRAYCLRCGATSDTASLLAGLRPWQPPACASCGGLVKPAVVLFGEALGPDFEAAEALVARCDLLIALGTSLEVWPVAGLVPQARRAGARVAIVGRDATAADDEADLVVRGELREIMRSLASALGLDE